MIKENEKIRRLEQSNYALRGENKKLRDENKKLRKEIEQLSDEYDKDYKLFHDIQSEERHKEPRLNYKGNINSFGDLPSEGNEEGDFYTYEIYDKLLDERCVGKYVRYKSKWIDLDRVIKQEEDERDEIIDHQKWEIEQLKESKKELQKELNAYEKLYEDESETTDKLISIIKTFSSLF